MSVAMGHRIRWILVSLLVFAWFVALALNVAGNTVHLLLLGAIAILVYELLVEDDGHRGASPPENPPR